MDQLRAGLEVNAIGHLREDCKLWSVYDEAQRKDAIDGSALPLTPVILKAAKRTLTGVTENRRSMSGILMPLTSWKDRGE